MEWLSPTEYLSSDPWDVFFQILLLFLMIVFSHRYAESMEKGIKNTILVVMIVAVVYYCVLIFAVGTALGTGLDHTVLVFLYLMGGGIVIYTLDSLVKKLDSWLLNREK
ncbi:MAG: hypothetical protein VYE70_00270 [Candidatus Thermoplasmatota archaeon]|nr:hypothetical protein [Candidatus Thermoplasmatota archaeon]